MFVDFLIEEKYNKYFYDENSNYSGLNIEMFVLRNGYYNDEWISCLVVFFFF